MKQFFFVSFNKRVTHSCYPTYGSGYMDVDETSLLTPSDDHVGNKSLTAIFWSHDPPLPGHAS